MTQNNINPNTGLIKNKALYDFRIYYSTLAKDRNFNDLLKWLNDIPVYSLIMFNANFNTDPAILSLGQHEKRAERLAKIVPEIYHRNIIPAINVLTTIGHGNKKALIREMFGFQPIVGADGLEVNGAVCPLDERFLEYVGRMYGFYARTGVEHIWTDDDIRIANHGQAYRYCFCPLHLKKLSEITGHQWTIEELFPVLSETENSEIYKIWNGINIDAMLNIFKKIEKAIHDINPGIRIGLMTNGCSSGRNIDKELQILKGSEALPLLRPGGGYWSDYDLFGAQEKRILIRSERPFREKDFNTSYELENYPYRSYLKSLKAIKFEMDLSILDGTDRIALNIFDDLGNLIDADGNYKRLLKKRHNFHLNLQKSIKNKKSCGINIIKNSDHSRNIDFRIWSENLTRLGIPVISNIDLAMPPTILCGSICETMDDRSLVSILEKGTIIDEKALMDLIKRNILDIKDIEILENDIDAKDIAYELFTDAPLNGDLVGRKREFYKYRNPGQPYNHYTSRLKIKNTGKYHTLSEWIGMDGKAISPSLVLYDSKAPSLVFPYRISKLCLLMEERAYQINRFLSRFKSYEGVWIKDLNCFPILYRSINEVILGIARFSLDPIKSLTVWLSAGIGNPKSKLQFFNNSGKWDEIDFELIKDPDLFSGNRLVVKKALKPVSVNIFRWKIK